MALITIGQIIDRSWQHYTKHFVALMSVSAWLFIAAILHIVSSTLYPSVGEPLLDLSAIQVFGIVLYLLTLIAVGPIVSIWVFNMLVRMIDRQANDRTVSLKEIRKEGWSFFFPRVLVGALVTLAFLSTLLLSVPGAVLSVASSAMESNAIAVLATVLLIVGILGTSIAIVIMSVRLFFSAYALLIENTRGAAALRASFALTKKRWWPVFFRVVIPKLLFFGGLFAIQMLLLLVLRVTILNLVGLNVTLATRLYTIGSTSIFIVLMAIINPLILIADYYLYQSVRKQ